MFRFNLSLLIALLVFSAPRIQGGEKKITGREIAVMVDERPEGKDRTSDMTMELINKRGRKRVRAVRSYYKKYGKDSKKIIYFLKPGDVKGVGFLSWEYDEIGKDDDRWLYMPALKKVKRISGSSENDYFMGTDFTYDDMGDRAVDEDKHNLLKEETVEGHDCWVMESIPVEKDYIYSKKIAWVRKDAKIAMKVDYYDKHGELMKTLNVPDIREQDGYWTIYKMVMENHQDEHTTVLGFSNIKYDNGLKDNLFRVTTLQRGRLK